MKKIIFAIIGAGLLLIFTNSCKHDVPKSTYCFQREILPIFKSSCTFSGCHNATDSLSGYIFEDYNSIISKGLIPGNAAGSSVYTSLFSTAAHPMPLDPYPLLDDKYRDMIKTWINEGALNINGCTPDCNDSSASFSRAVMPLIKVNCYGCHNSMTFFDFGGGYELSDYTTIQDQALNGQLIQSLEHNPSAHDMPKGFSKLTECQINIFKKWVAAGAPND